MKTVVADKDDFESRDQSKIITFWQFSDHQNSDAGKTVIIWFVNQIFSSSFMLLTETKMEETKRLVTESWEYQSLNELYIGALCGISDAQCSNAINKIDKNFLENFSTTKNLLVENLIKERKPLFMSDKRWWLWKTRRVPYVRYFWEFGTIKIQRTRSNFPPQYPSTSVMF